VARGRGHFAGVATVVAKLFNLVRPTRAYFGQKDAQQALLVARMVEDLDFPVEVIACPTVREPDGLALSSRNAYLTPAQRKLAPAPYRGLCLGRDRVRDGETDGDRLYMAMAEAILKDGSEAIELDYLHLVSPLTLEDVAEVTGPTLIAGAIKLGDVRLIDNVLVEP
jgi:pantoate--beta-alanine ligase